MRHISTPVLLRYVDAFAPRVIGLALHAGIAVAFGSARYAYPAWITVTYGFIFSLIPDPHGYVLVRSKRRPAGTLRDVVAVWVWSKAAIALGLTFIADRLFAAPQLRVAHDAPQAAFAAACFLGVSEVVWPVVSLVSFAEGTLVATALAGLHSRVIGLLACGFVYLAGGSLPSVLVAYSAPLLAVTITRLKYRRVTRRTWVLGLAIVRRYSGWAYLIGLVTAAPAQIATTMIGGIPSLSSSAVGQFAMFMRIITALGQPLQILQSILLKAYVDAGHVQDMTVRRYRAIFVIFGVLIAATGGALALLLPGISSGSDVIFGLLMIAVGAGIFAAGRYFMGLALAVDNLSVLGQRMATTACCFVALSLVWRSYNQSVALFGLLLCGFWSCIAVVARTASAAPDRL
jgi:hypothetical protein